MADETDFDDAAVAFPDAIACLLIVAQASSEPAASKGDKTDARTMR
jgi:hypothetical protein